jgi:DNA (cytosine-5)-methyltransferase 1
MRAVDLFSGFGGFTLGATWAGADVVWCANHWALAVRAHAVNHPATVHVCQDLRQADWTRLPAYDVLLAAPACQGHSSASQPGRRPYHDAMRSTAWAIVECADVTEPRALIVENVLAFRRWRLYPLWRAALERLGYTLTELVVNASVHGVPQRRQRLFIVGTSGRRVALGAASPELAFGPCLDLDDRALGWRALSQAQPGARRRILRAWARTGSRILVQHVTGHPGVSLDQPIRTLTTKSQWVLVDGERYRWLTPRELARGMGFPDSFALPAATRTDTVRLIGNAVCPPVARDIVRAVMDAA